MKIIDIIACIEKAAPLSYQESYDNSGLQTGKLDQEVESALLCLDVTQAVVEEAISKKSKLIIAHHPLIFEGLKRITGVTEVERVIALAIKNDIAIYAAHTNLDNIHTGVNQKICEKLGLHDLEILAPKTGNLLKVYTFVPHAHADEVRNAMFEAGGGHIGDYSESSFNIEGLGTFRASVDAKPFVGESGARHLEPEMKIEMIFPAYRKAAIIGAMIAAHPYEEVAYDLVKLENADQRVGAGMLGVLDDELSATKFMEHIKETMEVSVIRYAGLAEDGIKKVAVCGGSGSFLLKDAIKAGADAFITADFKYHQFFEGENQLLIADIGHYESEHFTMEIFRDLIWQNFPKFALHFTTVHTNPIKYFY